jgi:hypothetical protein
MAYHWLTIAFAELSPSARTEAARDLHAFIVELAERDAPSIESDE